MQKQCLRAGTREPVIIILQAAQEYFFLLM